MWYTRVRRERDGESLTAVEKALAKQKKENNWGVVENLDSTR